MTRARTSPEGRCGCASGVEATSTPQVVESCGSRAICPSRTAAREGLWPGSEPDQTDASAGVRRGTPARSPPGRRSPSLTSHPLPCKIRPHGQGRGEDKRGSTSVAAADGDAEVVPDTRSGRDRPSPPMWLGSRRSHPLVLAVIRSLPTIGSGHPHRGTNEFAHARSPRSRIAHMRLRERRWRRRAPNASHRRAVAKPPQGAAARSAADPMEMGGGASGLRGMGTLAPSHLPLLRSPASSVAKRGSTSASSQARSRLPLPRLIDSVRVQFGAALLRSVPRSGLGASGRRRRGLAGPYDRPAPGAGGEAGRDEPPELRVVVAVA